MENSSIREIKFVPKGWGFKKWIVNKEGYCDKFLYFVKGKKCSWHYHKLKDGLQNTASVILWRTDNLHVYKDLRYQMIALEDTELFEFSTQHFNLDSYRL